MFTNRARCAANAIKTTKALVESDEFGELSYLHAKLRLTALEADWAKFQALTDDTLDVVSKRDLPKVLQEYETTRVDYFLANAALQEKVAATCPHTESQPSTGDDSRQIQIQVNMPFQQQDVTNTWGQFDGAYTKWIGFRDMFEAAVHNNEKISPAFKFSYLKKALVGDAAATLGEWQLTEENYNDAWERLNSVYDKKYLIGRDHLRQLLDLPELRNRPSACALQAMANGTHEVMRQLKALGHPVEHWDFFVIHILTEKLDPETARQWELQRDSDHPRLATMLAFIDKQAAALSNVSNARQRSHGQGHPREAAALGQRQRQKPSRDEVRPCEVCNESHRLWECPDFIALSLRGRTDYVGRRAICANCLKHGHKENNCFMRGCVRCLGAPKHNIYLCPKREVNKPALAVVADDVASGSVARRRTKNKAD
ncbi:uncharacterized protein LOC129948177 [Eupeodes corollae]|uniref:uncharacterized protein LOC129948177 n=1 Tax=Eupeodes corollae TaxID=290404 RepID=UPI002490312C|nr:uncharacterized protein LOC129948177 [Eupeodes corollae]